MRLKSACAVLEIDNAGTDQLQLREVGIADLLRCRIEIEVLVQARKAPFQAVGGRPDLEAFAIGGKGGKNTAESLAAQCGVFDMFPVLHDDEKKRAPFEPADKIDDGP